jgi:predicted HicB family RNase H-like nuclease
MATKFVIIRIRETTRARLKQRAAKERISVYKLVDNLLRSAQQ